MKPTPKTYAQAFVQAARGAAAPAARVLAQRLWHIVARQHHLNWAKLILNEAAASLDKELGLVSVEVALPRPPEAKFKQTLERELSRALAAKLDVTYRLKPHLLAGAVVTLEDTRYDGSLKGRLEALYQALAGDKANGVAL